jgi:hypothetical protein
VKEKDERKSNESLQHRLKVERMIQAAVNRQSLLLVLRLISTDILRARLEALYSRRRPTERFSAGSWQYGRAARPNLKGRHEVRGSTVPKQGKEKGRVPHAVASTYKLYNASQIRAIS